MSRTLVLVGVFLAVLSVSVKVRCGDPPQKEAVGDNPFGDAGGAKPDKRKPAIASYSADESKRPGKPKVDPARPKPPKADGLKTAAQDASCDEAAERKIRQALASPTTIRFVDKRLKIIVDYLKGLHQIDIQLDTAALKDAGFDESTLLTKNFRGISLRSALRLLLDDQKLKYAVHNGVLLITSAEKAECDDLMETRFYPVEDLAFPENDGSVATKTWAENGGTGSVSPIVVGNRLLLAVSQSEEVHDQIENMLAKLRTTAGLKTAGLDASCDEAAERKIRQALASPTTVEFVDTRLNDIVDYLKDLHHIDIQLDAAALKDVDYDESKRLTKSLKGISLRSALRSLLDDQKLKYVVHNGVLLITSAEKAESDDLMDTRFYPVADLVLPAGNVSVKLQPLMDLLTYMVATKTWADNGGTGTLSVYPDRLLLVVSQTDEVHDQIENALAKLRTAGGLKTAVRDVPAKDTEGPNSSNVADQKAKVVLHIKQSQAADPAAGIAAELERKKVEGMRTDARQKENLRKRIDFLISRIAATEDLLTKTSDPGKHEALLREYSEEVKALKVLFEARATL